MDEFEKALAHYRQDLAEYPNNIWGLFGAHQVLEDSGKSDTTID